MITQPLVFHRWNPWPEQHPTDTEWSIKEPGSDHTAGFAWREEDARLWAAAPDLLAAAQAVIALLGEDTDLPDNGEWSGAAITDMLRAALDKATGQ